ncbi:MAG TPA: hypothetical protein VE965_09355, partial [Gammaproteobacteria bacterium]|nr:hypothetical protein [Gammaproteobacteria bacterium]
MERESIGHAVGGDGPRFGEVADDFRVLMRAELGFFETPFSEMSHKSTFATDPSRLRTETAVGTAG